MAGRRENQGLNFVRCMFCATSVIGVLPPGQRLEHREDGTHAFVDVVLPTPISSQAGLASIRRPDHRTVSMHADVRAVLDNVRMVQFYCGYMPEKPRGWDDDAVRMQLADAVYVLERLAERDRRCLMVINGVYILIVVGAWVAYKLGMRFGHDE